MMRASCGASTSSISSKVSFVKCRHRASIVQKKKKKKKKNALSRGGGGGGGGGERAGGDDVLPLQVVLCGHAGLMRAAAAQRTYAFERARLEAAGRSGGDVWERHVRDMAIDAWEMLETKLETKPVECFAAVAMTDDDNALNEELMRIVGSALRVVDPRGVCVASCDVTYDERLYGESLSGITTTVSRATTDADARGGDDDGTDGRTSSIRKAFFSDVSVMPQVRRRGVASTMLAHAMAHARERADLLYVHVDETNDAARALYARAGFVEEERESVQDAARRAGPGRGTGRRILLRAT